MKEVKIVLVPQLGVNDERAEIVKCIVKDGDCIKNGDLMYVLETTKAAYDVEAEYDGYVALLVRQSDNVSLGQPVAVIAETVEDALKYKQEFNRKQIKDDKHVQGNIAATKKAISLAKAHGLQLQDVSLGDNVIIRESDILQHLDKKINVEKMEISIPEKYIPVAIYGAGKGGVTILETLSLDKKYRAVCFVDDNPTSGISVLHDIPVFKSTELINIKEKGVLHVATEIIRGDVRLGIKKKVENLGFELINVIHPSSVISPSVRIGSGNYIKAGAVIETNTEIGDCCIIDNGAVIAHDNQIQDGCHIAPGAVLGSSIKLGYCTVVGIGASVSTNISIGKKCIISVGSSATKNISDNSVVDGVPGKVIGVVK